MSNYTEHYNLKKPLKSENYDVDVANTNNDIIDEKLYGKVDKLAGKGLSSNDFTDDYKKKIDMLQKIYKYKGSVLSVAKLNEITGQQTGDTYNIIQESKSYAWNGNEWEELGTTVDLSEVATVEHKYSLTLTANVASGGTITIPCYYKTNTGCLDVFYMGEKLLLSSDDAGSNGHYREVGTANSISNQIKLTSDWGAEKDEYFEFVVRGEYNA